MPRMPHGLIQFRPVDATSEHPTRLLVVDDEEGVRLFAERALRDAGYDVVLASAGPDALTIAERQGPFDAFILDIMMPQMRGDEVGRRLRRLDPDAKVLYFTGFSDDLFNQKQVLWEGEAFIEKPVTVQGLREAVSLLLFGDTKGLPR
jgi:two-component system cell cycle sensor histidine kinase/response regulator CckA